MLKKLFKDRNIFLKQCIPYIKHVRFSVMFLLIIKIICIFQALINPFLYNIFIDNVLINREMKLFVWVIVGFLSSFILNLILSWSTTYLSNKISNKISFSLKTKLLNRYFATPLEMYQKYNIGEVDMVINDDVAKVTGAVNEQIINYYINLISVVVYFTIILLINWQLCICLLITIPFIHLFTKHIGKGTKKINEEIRVINSEYRTWQNESLGAWKVVKSLGIEKNEMIKYIRFRHKIALLQVKWIFYWYLNNLSNDIQNDVFTKLLSYFVGGLFILNGNLTIGALLMFNQYFASFFAHIQNINNLNISLNSISPSYTRVFNMLNQTEIENETKILLGEFRELAISNLKFSYGSRDEIALNGINLRVKKGEIVVLAGMSGCGKSTLAKLLLKIHKPDTGNIKINNEDIETLEKTYFHSLIGAVLQDFVLFNLSIQDNLLLAKPNATHEEYESACKKAHIHDFIMSLPSDYKTIIGEKGIKLSGGQKQRLAIAQVILQDPEIIIFDEATSSLDYKTEKMINNSVKAVAKNKTVIMIAHRLSSVTYADKIAMMHDGCIIDIGTHSELLERCQRYADLYQMQSKINQSV